MGFKKGENMKNTVYECHNCRSEVDADYICVSCGSYVCEDCQVPFTQFNQCTEIVCEICETIGAESRADEYIKKEEVKKENEKKRLDKNALARKRYHSPEQKEKREKTKIEKILWCQEQREKRWNRMKQIFGIIGEK